MSDEGDEPTQTTPAGEEIPIPRRVEVIEAFRKVAKADEQEVDRESDDATSQGED